MVKSLAFLEVIGKQFGRRQNFFFFLWELALIKIAIHIKKLLGGKATRLLVVVFRVYYFLAIVPLFNNRLTMLSSHWLGL